MATADVGEVTPKATVLVVDDDRQICELLVGYLAELGCRVEAAFDGEEAVARIEGRQPLDIALIDFILPGRIPGTEVIGRAASAGVPVIAITGAIDAEERLAALPCPRLRKPFRLD